MADNPDNAEQTELISAPNGNNGDIHAAQSAAQAIAPSTLFSHPQDKPSDDGKADTDLDGEEKAALTHQVEIDIDDNGEPDENKSAARLFFENNRETIFKILKWIFFIFWIGYSLAAFIIDFKRARVLFVLEVIVLSWFVLRILYRQIGVGIVTKIIDFISGNKLVLGVIYAVLIILVIVAIILCSYEDPGRLIAALGLAIFIGGCYVLSWNRKAIKWRPVIWGFGLQFTFGLLILRTNPGFELFQWLGDAFKVLLDFTFYGSQFVFGYLATNQFSWPNGDSPEGFGTTGASVFAFSVIPTVIFFSSLVSVLYYLGVLQIIIYYLSVVMQYTLGTSSSESLNAAGNIFVGMTEAPLLIKPFLKNMTRSELVCHCSHQLLVSCFLREFTFINSMLL